MMGRKFEERHNHVKHMSGRATSCILEGREKSIKRKDKDESVGTQETIIDSWWAEGDAPVRALSQLAFLVDGRMTMLEMCICFLRAKKSISITAFGFTPDLLLVRGKHKCAGPAGSVEQEELLAWLRAKGLTKKDLRFWQECEELSVMNVLRYAVNKGVTVRVLLWDTYTLPLSSHPSPKDAQKMLEEQGVHCVLDDSHMGLLNHPLEAHHQKTAIVDSRFAFVGGIDVMMNSDGEFDRWDTKGHPYHTFLRLGKDGKMPHSWHDTHVLFRGPAVADVERNFCQRWNAVIELHKSDPTLQLPLPSASVKPRRPVPDAATSAIQVIRTIPKGTYAFASDGIATILEAYQRAFARAKHHIYLENQYLWQRTFLGFENPALGLPHADMQGLLHALADALARGVVVTLVLPDNPNVGREFTDEGLKALRELAPQAVEAGLLQVYTLGSSMHQQEHTSYRSIYVHAKTTIVDDSWVTLGSANLNNRGMRDDTELNVAVLHPELAQRLRILLMAEHLGLCDEDTLFQMLDTLARVSLPLRKKNLFVPTRESVSQGDWASAARPVTGSVLAPATIDKALATRWATLVSQLGDPIQGTALFAKQARENLQAVTNGQAIAGHLLPYIPHDQAQDYGIDVHAVNGWLDTLPEAQREPEVLAEEQAS